MIIPEILAIQSTICTQHLAYIRALHKYDVTFKIHNSFLTGTLVVIPILQVRKWRPRKIQHQMEANGGLKFLTQVTHEWSQSPTLTTTLCSLLFYLPLRELRNSDFHPLSPFCVSDFHHLKCFYQSLAFTPALQFLSIYNIYLLSFSLFFKIQCRAVQLLMILRLLQKKERKKMRSS